MVAWAGKNDITERKEWHIVRDKGWQELHICILHKYGFEVAIAESEKYTSC